MLPQQAKEKLKKQLSNPSGTLAFQTSFEETFPISQKEYILAEKAFNKAQEVELFLTPDRNLVYKFNSVSGDTKCVIDLENLNLQEKQQIVLTWEPYEIRLYCGPLGNDPIERVGKF